MNSKSIFNKTLLTKLNSTTYGFFYKLFHISKIDMDLQTTNELIYKCQHIAVSNEDDIFPHQWILYYLRRKELIKRGKAPDWMYWGVKQ